MSIDLSTLVRLTFKSDLEGFLAAWDYNLVGLAKQPNEELLLALV